MLLANSEWRVANRSSFSLILFSIPYSLFATRHSLIPIPASPIERLAARGIRDHRVVAGHVGEAAEIERVAELGLAGRELLVAAGRHAERVSHGHRLAHRLPQLDPDRRCRDAVTLPLHGARGVRAGGEDELAAAEPA